MLKSIAETTGYSFDKELGILYGNVYGYQFVVQAGANNQYLLLCSVKGPSEALEIQDLTKELKSSNKSIVSASFKQFVLSCTIKSGMTKKKTQENIQGAIDVVGQYLSDNGYVNCCQLTGETGEVGLYAVATGLMFLSPASYTQISQEMGMQEQEAIQVKENVWLGTLGAVLGSLIGVAAIVIIGQLGYVSAISGLVMGACVVKGYQLFGKKFSTRGAIISALVVLVMTFVANQLDWAFTISSAYDGLISVFEAFNSVGVFLETGQIEMSTYLINLGMIYIASAIVAGAMIFDNLKDAKRAFDLRKLM